MDWRYHVGERQGMNPYGDDMDVALRALLAAFHELPAGNIVNSHTSPCCGCRVLDFKPGHCPLLYSSKTAAPRSRGSATFFQNAGFGLFRRSLWTCPLAGGDAWWAHLRVLLGVRYALPLSAAGTAQFSGAAFSGLLPCGRFRRGDAQAFEGPPDVSCVGALAAGVLDRLDDGFDARVALPGDLCVPSEWVAVDGPVPSLFCLAWSRHFSSLSDAFQRLPCGGTARWTVALVVCL